MSETVPNSSAVTNNREAHNDIEAKYPASYQNSPAPIYASPTIANPGPLGLSSFALTTFVLSLHNAGAGVPANGPSNVVVGLGFFYGGLVQVNTMIQNWDRTAMIDMLYHSYLQVCGNSRPVIPLVQLPFHLMVVSGYHLP